MEDVLSDAYNPKTKIPLKILVNRFMISAYSFKRVTIFQDLIFGVRLLKPVPSSRCGRGWFYLSESKCTVSARILHGFKPCRGYFSVQNPTKDAEITGWRITLFWLKNTMTRNFHELRRTGGLLSWSVGSGFESLEMHHKEHEAEMLGAFSFVFSESKKTSAWGSLKWTPKVRQKLN